MFVGLLLTVPYIRRDGVGTPHGRCGPLYGLSNEHCTIRFVHLQEVFAYLYLFSHEEQYSQTQNLRKFNKNAVDIFVIGTILSIETVCAVSSAFYDKLVGRELRGKKKAPPDDLLVGREQGKRKKARRDYRMICAFTRVFCIFIINCF